MSGSNAPPRVCERESGVGGGLCVCRITMGISFMRLCFPNFVYVKVVSPPPCGGKKKASPLPPSSKVNCCTIDISIFNARVA